MLYLDNAATSFPKAPGVAEAVRECLESPLGNPGRSSNPASVGASRIVFETREAVMALLGLPGPSDRLVFTKNATEALNLGIAGAAGLLAARVSGPGSGARPVRVATTSLEHNAVMRPLRALERSGAASLRVMRFDGNGSPLPGEIEAALGGAEPPDFVVMTAASNVTGAVLPVGELAARCRASGILFGLDASQAAGHIPLAEWAAMCDFMAFPGHKGLLGPAGTGALWLAPGFSPEPLLRGGTGSDSDSEYQPEFLPDRYEAGTVNFPGLAGLGAAAAFLAREGVGNIAARVDALADRLAQGLAGIPGARIHGRDPGGALPAAGRTPIVSMDVLGASIADLAHGLDRAGIAVRMGLHCAPAAHRSMGTFDSGGTLRFSPGFATTEAEIDVAVDTVSRLTSERGKI